MALSANELERYSRQILLQELGEKGQETLKRSSVLVIGAGGVGSPCALYLAAAGIGTIGLADGDTVALSNLHRQILYGEKDVGMAKAVAARDALRQHNSGIRINTYDRMLDFAAVKRIAEEYDFVIEAVDGMAAKIMVADACAAAKRPHCHAGIGQFRGQVMTCLPEIGNCFSCLFEAGNGLQPVRTGTLNAACGVAGCIQAAEAIKYLLQSGSLLTNRVLYFDLLRNCFAAVPFCRRIRCKEKAPEHT